MSFSFKKFWIVLVLPEYHKVAKASAADSDYSWTMSLISLCRIFLHLELTISVFNRRSLKLLCDIISPCSLSQHCSSYKAVFVFVTIKIWSCWVTPDSSPYFLNNIQDFLAHCLLLTFISNISYQVSRQFVLIVLLCMDL